ncbi:hypothetical protein [uncultured Helicobacter sp.]|uniref:hypothetical protein n=1 Tax=uncultured Helicobacter sp. TaxID=175537 RepID=UPI00260C8175|nr:hypothetical protein [uncultured Helicobacter sp.]
MAKKTDDKQSVKSDAILQGIKQEFEQDEKILESAFRLERLVKKYKYYLIALVVLIVAWVGYRSVYGVMTENKAQKISALYTELTQNPDNTLLQDQLQAESKGLYDLYTLMRIDLAQEGAETHLKELVDSPNPLVRELATYELASLKQENLSQVSGVMADFAKIQQAYLYLSKNQIPEARKELESIGLDSALYGIASQMKHYGITKYPLESALDLKEVGQEMPSKEAQNNASKPDAQAQ